MSIPYQADIGEKAKKVATLIVQGHGRDVSQSTITRLVGQAIQEERDRCLLIAAAERCTLTLKMTSPAQSAAACNIYAKINEGYVPTKQIRLRYDLLSANRDGNYAPASSTMAAYNIAWESTKEYPDVNCVVFEGCANIPDDLPSYITVLP